MPTIDSYYIIRFTLNVKVIFNVIEHFKSREIFWDYQNVKDVECTQLIKAIFPVLHFTSTAFYYIARKWDKNAI